MILKELPDPPRSHHPWALSGYQAEKQIAFHLKRAFAHDPAVKVLNGIRLDLDGDIAQCDHLILHRHGLIIVESKSVSSEIRVNERGEWSREYQGQWQGMPSPINQAKAQGEFFRKYLQPHAPLMIGKALGLQPDFSRMPINVIVAVSDDGIIHRPSPEDFDEVCKADQVPDKIKDWINHHQKINAPLSLNFSARSYAFKDEELSAIGYFLLASHKPYEPKKPEVEIKPSRHAEEIKGRSDLKPQINSSSPPLPVGAAAPTPQRRPEKPVPKKRELTYNPALERPRKIQPKIAEKSDTSPKASFKATPASLKLKQRRKVTPAVVLQRKQETGSSQVDRRLNEADTQTLINKIAAFLRGESSYKEGLTPGAYKLESDGHANFTLRKDDDTQPILVFNHGELVSHRLKESDFKYFDQLFTPTVKTRKIYPPRPQQHKQMER